MSNHSPMNLINTCMSTPPHTHTHTHACTHRCAHTHTRLSKKFVLRKIHEYDTWTCQGCISILWHRIWGTYTQSPTPHPRSLLLWHGRLSVYHQYTVASVGATFFRLLLWSVNAQKIRYMLLAICDLSHFTEHKKLTGKHGFTTRTHSSEANEAFEISFTF